jgi:hypothetical protein
MLVWRRWSRILRWIVGLRDRVLIGVGGRERGRVGGFGERRRRESWGSVGLRCGGKYGRELEVEGGDLIRITEERRVDALLALGREMDDRIESVD